MKNYSRFFFALMIVMATTMAFSEEYLLLKTKVQLLVNEAKGYFDESFQKGSAIYGAAYQYYFGLMCETGKELLTREESTANKQKLKNYYDLIAKDYESYTKVESAVGRAAATGSDRIFIGRRMYRSGNRHRAKRLINAEKLRDKELSEAVKRWERFAVQVKKESDELERKAEFERRQQEKREKKAKAAKNPPPSA